MRARQTTQQEIETAIEASLSAALEELDYLEAPRRARARAMPPPLPVSQRAPSLSALRAWPPPLPISKV